jgi:hypothetical protein
MGLFKRWALGIICVGFLVVLIFRNSNSSKNRVSPVDARVSPVAIAQKEMPQLEMPPVVVPISGKQTQLKNGESFQLQLAMALTMPEGPAKKLRLDQIFTLWGQQDGQAALASAVAEFEKSGNLSMMRSALHGISEVNPGGALDLLKAMNLSDRIKTDMGSELLGQWVGKDAASASRWVTGNRYKEWWGGPAALVAEVWARSDPQSAIQWSSQLSPGLDQMSALVAATSRWSKTDLQGVADYVSRQSPGSSRDIMAGTLAHEFGQEDPLSGLKWAAAVQDPTGRQRAAAGAVADVYAKDPGQVKLILKQSDLSPQEQTAVLGRLQNGPWWK